MVTGPPDCFARLGRQELGRQELGRRRLGWAIWFARCSSSTQPRALDAPLVAF